MVSLSAAVLLLPGCGGLRPSVAAAGAMPQSRAITTQPKRGRSWMLPDVNGGSALIYTIGSTEIYIVSYRSGHVVKAFANPGAFWGLCSDTKGNIFIPIKGSILEYKHGGIVPIAKLKDAKELGYACSIDPVTGNLAVVNATGSGNVAIYANAIGKPTFLTDPSMRQYFACTYDNAGDLVINGEGTDGATHLAELAMGSGAFQDLTLNERLSMSDLHWDGQYVAVGDEDDVYQIAISGSEATVVGKTVLKSRKGAYRTFWIQGNNVLAPVGPGVDAVGLWKYPSGGNSISRYFVAKKADLRGVTVSVAPRH